MMMIGSTTSEYQQENRKMFLERSRDTTNGADSVLVGAGQDSPLRILSAALLISVLRGSTGSDFDYC
jgi:uncharacterized SAM-dependent methyltransferase